jgi:hypothetical protein
MNWGYKLMFVFIVFALLMGTLVYKSMNTKYELLSKDYYKDELKYQDRIDAKNESSKISDLSIFQNKDSIIINFPKELGTSSIQSDIWFYCKTDEIKDKHFKFESLAGKALSIPVSSINKANYQVKVNYKTTKTNYYSEKDIIVR